jgi:DNA-binding response OmpR family regulator
MSTVLVVDDDVQFASALCRTLNRNGFKVLRLEDGTEVPDTLSKVQADAVVLDLQMPGMNGWEVMRALRDRMSQPQHRGRVRPKIVVLSGRDEAETAAFASRLGADAYLTKPLGGAQIVQTLRQVLAK